VSFRYFHLYAPCTLIRTQCVFYSVLGTPYADLPAALRRRQAQRAGRQTGEIAFGDFVNTRRFCRRFVVRNPGFIQTRLPGPSRAETSRTGPAASACTEHGKPGTFHTPGAAPPKAKPDAPGVRGGKRRPRMRGPSLINAGGIGFLVSGLPIFYPASGQSQGESAPKRNFSLLPGGASRKFFPFFS